MQQGDETPVSHIDLYHKLGRLEALMETMMSSVSNFQVAIKDLHSRIDSLETRQAMLEKRRATDNGALSALVTLGKDFAIPVLAIVIAWMAARGDFGERFRTQKTEHYSQPEHVTSHGSNNSGHPSIRR